MTLLCLIFAVLLVRSLLALVTWVALGRCLWLFPFLLSEARPPALLETLCCSQQVAHVHILMARVTRGALAAASGSSAFLLSEARPQALLDTPCCSQQVALVYNWLALVTWVVFGPLPLAPPYPALRGPVSPMWRSARGLCI